MSERAKILIVDDEPFNVDYLEQELEDFGHDTISGTNGQEALAKVAAENPDLILLDVMMPLMDGFTVCRILREQEDTRLISIVMMTALEVHLVLKSGVALVGSTRFEGVHGARWTFTASGTVTNLVFRLADIAKAGEILIGLETARRLGERYRLQRLGWEQLKNRLGERYQLQQRSEEDTSELPSHSAL